MKLVRQILFWLHLSAGLTAGVVVAIMSLTGVGLMYQRQIQLWADRGAWRPPEGAAAPLGLEALIAKVHEQQPASTIATVTLRSDRNQLASVAVYGARQGTLLVDPYTGQIVPASPRGDRVRAAFRTMTDWHRYLAAAGDNRATGRMLTGASNLLFFFLVLSGAYLWWPRNWRLAAIRNVVVFRRGLSGRPRDFNWHNVIGFWSAIPLAVVVGSAVVMSYPWANDFLYRLAGDTAPSAAATARPAGASAEGRGDGRAATTGSPVTAGLDAAVAKAAAQFPGWGSLGVRVPGTDRAPITIAVDEGDGGQPQKRGTLTLDRTTADVTRWEPFSSQTTGRRWRSFIRFAHTGEAFGLLGQTIAGLASAGAVFLVYTGVSLACRRLLAWVRRRRQAREFDLAA